MTTTPVTAPTQHETVDAAAVTITISNTCQCLCCDACALLFEEDPTGPDECPDCGSTDVTFGDCGGDCYVTAVDDLTDVVAQWAEANPSIDNEWVITGTGMGWRNLTGTKHIDLTTDCLSDAISVDSEWTQSWTVAPDPGGTLSATQSHHDSPTGESYTVVPLR